MRLVHTAGVAAIATVTGLTVVPIDDAGAAPPRPTTVESAVFEQLEAGGPIAVVVVLDGHQPDADVTELHVDARTAQDEVLDELGDGVRITDRFTTVPAFAATVESEEALRELAAQPSVVAVGLADHPAELALANTVPIINADALHAMGVTGDGVTVAVLDTGVDLDHPDLDGATVAEACFSKVAAASFCHNGEDEDEGPGSAEDDNGHGTAVTGVVTSDGEVSSVGVAPDSSIVALKVGDADANVNLFDVGFGLEYLVDHPELGVDVANMSLGSLSLHSGVCDNDNALFQILAGIIANLRAAGILPIAVSGNDGSSSQMRSPGCLSGVLSIGATNVDDDVAAFSNTNAETDVMAPGDGVVTDEIGGGVTGGLSGTSVAAPAVAGCAALIEEGAPTATLDQIEAALEATAVRVRRAGTPFRRIHCEAGERTLAHPAHGYPDVVAGSLADLGLRWAKAEAVVVADFPDGGFHPDAAVNRGQIVNMLWTLMGMPGPNPPHGFAPPDVPAGAFYRQALDWAKAQGLVSGYIRRQDCRPLRAPCYRPRDPVLRGQLVNMGWQMVGAPTGLPAFAYTDIPASAFYRQVSVTLAGVRGLGSYRPCPCWWAAWFLPAPGRAEPAGVA